MVWYVQWPIQGRFPHDVKVKQRVSVIQKLGIHIEIVCSVLLNNMVGVGVGDVAMLDDLGVTVGVAHNSSNT